MFLSNGVGRTGTFISVYAGVEEVNHANGILDIQTLCQKMMKKRRYIIRDKEQLKYCYDTILYHAEDLLMKRKAVSCINFLDKLVVFCNYIFSFSDVLNFLSSAN